ncbi:MULTISPECIES: hypothetical protein [Ralstonia]|jgi:hypothetical protein|uniref:Uncharacterized protein n=2 Tax=Ralstonia pickettii TaxID=329 RepID=R0CMV5_RALPI|nr:MULTISPECIES: hypothetical protein [Ralstonia]ENZ77996.1 hypothetical protein OR214_02272 [Ralstonia pickettii OR214]MCM3581914.1 hypothetical protein [Ralstonia pickettii]
MRKVVALASKCRSFLANCGTSIRNPGKVKELCRRGHGGVRKRIDENRELLELLQQESPELLARCPLIEGWLGEQDRFLNELAAAVGIDDEWATRKDWPRPWPGRKRAQA